MAVIQCRRCNKALFYKKLSDLPFFPFCGKRCKLIDLGEWLDEEHRIADNSQNPQPDDDSCE